MSSVKVKFRPSSGTIYYQVIHNRVPRQISTSFRLNRDEWDSRRFTTVSSPPAPRSQLLLAVQNNIRWDIERLNRIVRRLSEQAIDFTSDDIVAAFRAYRSKYSFANCMLSAISLKLQKGHVTTAQHYRAALSSFRKFLADLPQASAVGIGIDDFMLDSLSSEIMEQYEAWLQGRGVCPNTISFYIRIFRAVYRRAVDDGIIADRRPFRHVYTGIDRTVKRALPLSVISRIRSLDLALNPRLDFVRDMFMLSFYLRGMSFIDMAFLRKSDLTDGFLTYHRRKTGQRLTISWTREMQDIIDKYPPSDSEYLLPIIPAGAPDPRAAYLNASSRLNAGIKQIGRLLDSADSQQWSFYRARHSWASAAHSKGIPLSIISEGMGHDSETTTRIYLASLDTSLIDQANALIISSL